MNLPPPLISIIIASLNNRDTIQQAIDSVALQTYQHVELIIIDGCSNDGTVDILADNQYLLSYLISEPDNGIYNAWNKGLAHSKGDWICFIGADDFLWNNNVLQQTVQHLQTINDHYLVAYGQVMRFNREGVPTNIDGTYWPLVKKKFKKFMCIPHPATFHRRELFQKHGYYDESFLIAGDYELLLRELKTDNAFFIQDIIVTGVRYGGISTNQKNTIKSLTELRRAQKMHGFHFPSYWFIQSMINEYIRIIIWGIFGESLVKKLIKIRQNNRKASWIDAENSP